MIYRQQSISTKVARVLGRWRRLIIIRGLAKTVAVTLLLAAASVAADRFLELEPAIRLGLLLLAVGAALYLFSKSVILPLLRAPSEAQIARYIEERHPNLQDRLVTAVELGENAPDVSSKFIVEKLLEDTQEKIATIDLTASLKSGGATLWSSAAALLLTGAILVLMNGLSLNLQPGRWLRPFRYRAEAPRPALRIQPGNARILKGESSQISAALSGFEAEEVFLYYAQNDSTWKKAGMDETSEANVYVLNLFNLASDTRYYVRADAAISEVFQLTVFDAPRITRVDLSYNFPKYTGLPPRKEEDSGDIWAPVGTKVTITGRANKALKTAAIVLEGGRALATHIASDSLFSATFTVKEDTYYKIRITGTDDLTNPDPQEYYVHAIPDEPPSLTLERPSRDIRATMLEETPVRVSIQDDYGAPTARLKYAVNGSKEQIVKLRVRREIATTEPDAGALNTFVAEHLFYIENLGVRPGDFISYYVEAADAGSGKSTAVSDIYFIEIRPFETEFTRPLSEGQSAGAGSAAGRLSRTQKEIIVATWKTEQRKSRLTAEKLDEDITVLRESQKNLQEVTQSALFQLQQRSVPNDDASRGMSKHYSDAVGAMQKALERLAESNLAQAQTPQREALQSLLQAEAQIRQIQVQRSRSATGSGNTNLSELSQLFEDQADKLKNKYETLNQSPSNQSEGELNDALRKVKELARRQQKFNRDIRDLARKDMREEERKRRADELRRQQEQLRRQTQELARGLRKSRKLRKSLPRNVQKNLRQATSEMNNAAHNLRNNNRQLAAAKGARALNQLQQLQDLLQRHQTESLRRQVKEVEKQFRDLAEGQRELAGKVQKMAAKGKKAESAELSAAENRQQSLLRDLSKTMTKFDALEKQARRKNNSVSRQIGQLGRQLAGGDIQKKMKNAQKLLREKKLRSADRAQKDILERLEQAENELTKLRSALAESEAERLDLALNETRRLRERLESMRRQGQTGSQNASPTSGKSSGKDSDPGPRQRSSDELARGLNDLNLIQQALDADSSLSGATRALGRKMRNILKSFSGGEPGRMRLIQQQILPPLQGLEAELAQKLELIRNKERLFLVREESVPRAYREMVEKYYESLSKTRK